MRFIAKGIEIPVDNLRPSPFQPRINFNLQELEPTIRSQGILDDLVVRQLPTGIYEIIDGERRWRIAKNLEMPTVPCVVVEADDETARKLVWTLNVERKDYEPEEKAVYFKELHEKGLSFRKIAEVTRLSPHTIIAYCNVFKLPEKYQKLVWAGKIPIGIINELESLLSGVQYCTLATKWLDVVLEKGLGQKEIREALAAQPPEEALEKLEKAEAPIPEKLEAKIREEIKEEVKEEVKQELLSKPRVVEEAWETLQYNQLCEREPFLAENKHIVNQKALTPFVKALSKGQLVMYQHLILGEIREEVEKRKPSGKRLTRKDVAKMMKKYAKTRTHALTEEEAEYDDFIKHYPYPLVTFLWDRLPRTKRLELTRRYIEIMYNWLEHRAEEIYQLVKK